LSNTRAKTSGRRTTASLRAARSPTPPATHRNSSTVSCAPSSHRVPSTSTYRATTGGPGTLAELIADPRAEDGFDTVDRKLDADVLRHRPNDLCARERAVLRARYSFDGPVKTLHEVGEDLDLSAERVRQIQEHALDKLQVAGSTVLSEVASKYVRAGAARTPA
jgi:hypothetical protein